MRPTDPRDPQRLLEQLSALAAQWHERDKQLCRKADAQPSTQYAHRMAALAEGYGRCADQLESVVALLRAVPVQQAAQARIDKLTHALGRIADHDFDRWQSGPDGEMERQPTQNDIARDALDVDAEMADGPSGLRTVAEAPTRSTSSPTGVDR